MSSRYRLQDEDYFVALVRMFEQALAAVSALPAPSRDTLLPRLARVRSISQQFGYGVGVNIDSIFMKYTKRKT